ncbi:MAG TPA: hypothetical protein DGN59_10455, partial [Candidatus Latescibacteria bacterium]|nr:hypothetical protein [Candidatus Latescibacterota bacterium]
MAGESADHAAGRGPRLHRPAYGAPGYAFQYSMEALLGTGVARHQDFFRQAMRYRETLRQFVRARDAQDSDSPHGTFLGILYVDKT